MNDWTIFIFIQSAHTDTEKPNAKIETGALQILDFVAKLHFNLKWKIDQFTTTTSVWATSSSNQYF